MATRTNTADGFRCPRCGGAMYKPAGSSLYWHATHDHPPCSITNIAASALPSSGSGRSQSDALPRSRR